MALRLACLFCFFSLFAGVSVGPVGAYPCGGTPGSARNLSAHLADPDKECSSKPSPRVHHNADPISFAFFIGLIAAVLLVPAALVRRKDEFPE